MHSLGAKPVGLIVVFMGALALGSGDARRVPFRWQPVGDRQHVNIEDGAIRLDAPAAATSGVISRPFAIDARVNAVLITADVDESPGRGITFAVHDAGTGNTLGYWQNPLPVDQPTEIAAVLPLAKKAGKVRLFVGTHDRPSTASIRNLRWKPVFRGMNHDRSVYGVRIDGSTTPRQTFKATGPAMAAVEIRARQLKAGVGGPDLRVRLYKWAGSLSDSLAIPPLAETIVPRRLFSGDAGIGGDEMIVTYGADEIDMAVPLAATTTPGETYMLEFAVYGPCGPSQGFISYGWVDGYPDGQLFKNQSPQDWDMWMNVYHSDR